MNMFMDPLGQLYSTFSTRESGLTSEEVEKKLQTFGKNELPKKKTQWLNMLINEFSSPLVFILLLAVVMLLLVPFLENGYIEMHDLIEPLAIIVILIFNGFLGFFQAWKAENTLEALKTLQPQFSSVLRDGNIIQMRTEDLVPGDIIMLAEGEKIPADIRLITSIKCTVNESLLTGESSSIHKNADINRTENGENILYSGSELLSGRAKGLVIATGLDTKIGKIADLISSIQRPISPMQRKLELLAKKIGIGMIGLCLVVFVLATMREIYWIDALFTAIAIAVAAVPEGLPTVMTISLAIGVSVMARKNALVRDLKSVESLGSVTVIASDKTGTITQNKMSVEQVFYNGEIIEKNNFSSLTNTIFEIAENCNDAVLPNIGDPTEIALLEFSRHNNAKKYERIDETPFSSESKFMNTVHEIDEKKITFIKGAPEIIALQCEESERKKIIHQAEQMAKKGLRTLAFATQKPEEKHAQFIAIVGLQDPPRENVKASILTAQKAGIKTLMITGDHAITAKAIASQVGINSDVLEGKDLEKISDTQLRETVKKYSIFARVSPHDKVRICKALQQNGEIVAMTGDGVNDAPAIKQAQVGISMGKVGTSVARSASDMVLLNDDYSTIVSGVEQGRRIFDNIKKAIIFLLATNFAEILVLLVALLFALPIPLLPLHILFINLLTDSIPALALATEPAEKDIMNAPPRPANEGFFTGSFGLILFLGVMVSGLVLSFYTLALSQGIPLKESQTFTFVSLSILEMAVIFSLRTHKPFLSFESFNWWVLGAVITVLVITIGVVLSPLAGILQLALFPNYLWSWIAGGFILVIVLLEIFKVFSKRW